MTQLPEETKKRLSPKKVKDLLKGLDTSGLCDIKKDLRVMSFEIRPIFPKPPLLQAANFFGRARTVSVLDDFLTVIKALNEAEPGEVLVIDGRGGTKALLGELFCAEAIRKKLAGIVVDGACRDIHTIRAQYFPVWSRLHTPMAGTCRQLFETQTRITCGGVTVEPGDILFGDDDGIVVMSDDELVALAEHAWTLQKVERHVLAEVRKGKPLLDMTNALEHLKAIADGKESKLCFDLLNDTEMN